MLETSKLSADQWRLLGDISYARQGIEEAMKERRKLIEVAKTRKVQTADKYRAIARGLLEQRSSNRFSSIATQEVITLQQVHEEVRDDMLRHKIRAHRDSQRALWTVAPPGYANRRGKSLRGPVLGQGPLPPNATSHLKDPRMEATTRKYYWDSCGRRHVKGEGEGEEGELSLVDKAMNSLRKAAANVSAYKLDLHAIFNRVDTSGDGLLSEQEMAQAFLDMGVPMDQESMRAIFRHVNRGGTVGRLFVVVVCDGWS